MNRFVRVTAWALVFALTSAPATRAHADELAPMVIVQRALVTWSAHPTPPVIAYDLNFTGKRKGGSFTRVLHVVYDAGTRTYTGQLLASTGTQPPGVDAERQRLFPDETFGLVPRSREAAVESPNGESLHTVGGSRTYARYPYDVSLAGTDTLDGRPAYHLLFVPRGDAERSPVRDVWVDAASFEVRRIVVYKVEHAGLLHVPFFLTVDYGASGPYWLVQRGDAGATAHVVFFTISAQGTALYTNFTFPERTVSGG